MSIAESAFNLLKINAGENSPAASLTPYKPKTPKTPRRSDLTAAGKPRKKRRVSRTPAPAPGTHSVSEEITSESVYNIPQNDVINNTTPAPARAHNTRNAPAPRGKNTHRVYVITDEIFDSVCVCIETGDPVRRACKKTGVSYTTFNREIERTQERRERYASARRKQADALFEKAIIEAENCDGTQESFNRARLRIDVYKWACGKLYPSKYSEKAQIAVTGADGGPVAIAAAVVPMQEVKAVRDMLNGAIAIDAEEVTPAALEDRTGTPEDA